MLQLCDDSPKSHGSLICITSFFTILAALYFVDFKKKFSISRTICNTLLILAVIAQTPTLLHSREDFLAFSIANVLASLQTILFFQHKTLRKSYQILAISFVEVAVGCVFQRSVLFIVALPVYSILAFICFSQLFLWGERKFYTERVVLKKRFSRNKTLALFTEEDNVINSTSTITPTEIDNKGAYQFGLKFLPTNEMRFFRRRVTLQIKFGVEYFRRFTINALNATFFASVFFFLFPRIDQIGFGQFQFDAVNWNGTRGGHTTKTGFKQSIELGDLGPVVDSHSPVMEIQFFDELNPANPNPVDPQYPVFFRGISLANYKNHIWTNVQISKRHDSAKELIAAIINTSITDPSQLASKEILTADKLVEQIHLVPSPSNNFEKSKSGQIRDSFLSYHSTLKYDNETFRKTTFFPSPPTSLPQGMGINFLEMNDEQLDEELAFSTQIFQDRLKYDLRSQLVNMKIRLNRLDIPIVFTINPFFVIKNTAAISGNRSFGVQISSDEHQQNAQNEFWFLTSAFQDGKQLELSPNQEKVWPILDQYLAIDKTTFPQLIEKAKSWDAESQLPEEDFIGRARYIEIKLRDSGEYKYNRFGVLRNPNVDPLEDFISEHKEGHCEYFAGALALLLRAIGIPSRVVVGYTCYPNKDIGPTIVRQSDAHSWVEAYIPPEKLPKFGSSSAHFFAGSTFQTSGEDYIPRLTKDWIRDGAWFRLDATPSTERNSERLGVLAVGIYNWSYLLHHFGSDFIMNFNGARQMKNVYQPLSHIWQEFVSNLRRIGDVFTFFKVFFSQLFETSKRFLTGDWTPVIVIRVLLSITMLCAISYFLRHTMLLMGAKLNRNRKQAQNHKTRRTFFKDCDETSAKLYNRVEKVLEAHLQIKRKEWETPREFLVRSFQLEDRRQVEKKTPVVQTTKSNEPKAFIKKIFSATLLSQIVNCSKHTHKQVSTLIPKYTKNQLLHFIDRYYQAQFGNLPITIEEADYWIKVFQQISN